MDFLAPEQTIEPTEWLEPAGQEFLTLRRTPKITLSPRRSRPKWTTAVAERLNEISKLSADWDGYGSSPPSTRVILIGIDWIRRFMPEEALPPSIVPTPEGGIQLEWHVSEIDLEVTFSPNLPAEVYCIDHETGDEWEGELPDCLEQLVLAIKALTARAKSG